MMTRGKRMIAHGQAHAEDPLGSGGMPVPRDTKVEPGPNRGHGSIQVHPPPDDANIGFINPGVEFWSVRLRPTPNGIVIDA